MSDYMMIFIGSNYGELGLSPEEIQVKMGKWWEWQGKMEGDGILKGGNALQPTAKRISGENRVVSDGPFAESKEMVGGYYIVSAENAGEVEKIAQGYPDYDLGGTVEIREILVYEK